MLKLEGVTKKFAGNTAVDNVSFEISAGEVVGFLGPNGAGKTTTMRMIAGLIQPDDGSIVFDGNSIIDDSLSIKQRLGYMPENNPLYSDMLVSEYLEYIASFKPERSSLVQVNRNSTGKNAVRTAVAETNIKEVFYRPILELSKGYKQRVGLAAAIMGQPDLLILDEPAEGLDPNQRITIRDLIKSLGSKRTVLLSTHVLQEVTATCSRVIIINHGKIVADNSTSQLVSEAKGKRKITLEVEGIDSDGIGELEAVEGVEALVHKEQAHKKVMLELAVHKNVDPRGTIFDLAKKGGWRIWDMHQESLSLEDVFRELTIEDGSTK